MKLGRCTCMFKENPHNSHLNEGTYHQRKYPTVIAIQLPI